MAFSIYPTLNLEFSVVKRPKQSVGVAAAASGRETRTSYWQYPMWEWDLSYEYLPDAGGGWQAGITASDIRTLMAFYTIHTDFLTFLFEDIDDNQVLQAVNPMAVGDGTTLTFPVTRAFGAGGFTTIEPVGYVNLGHPFNVYDNGVLVNPATYTLDQTVGYNQTITFTSAPPAAGHVISSDVFYYYLARFKEASNEFEKFMDKLWSLKKTTIMSTRE